MRAAHALRASARRADARARARAHTRAARGRRAGDAELSLAHTLETAVERVAELLAAERVAVYLRDDEDGLLAAAARGLAGPHARVAERLLELALGPPRGRGRSSRSPTLATDAGWRRCGTPRASRGSRRRSPCRSRVRDEVIGLLAVYPRARRGGRRENEETLLRALAVQLAVAVQNAQLHEQTDASSATQREQALASEREAARRLRALYEISRSFAQSLSLDTTLEALAATVVELLDVDAAVIRMPDARREQLVPRAMHVKDGAARRRGRARSSSGRSRSARRRLQRLFRDAAADPRRAGAIGDELLGPFLEKGWTGAVRPGRDAGRGDRRARRIFSLDPERPIAAETLDAALAIAGQAALAIDNARLYQQQKEFADTMQRSLLPRAQPDVAGLEVGDVYESSARVEVGGDVYDFVDARRRPARGRARRRDRPRRRGDRRHGDDEVRLPLARARASRAGRLPRRRERGRRRRDRAGQVHHDGVPRRRRRQRRGRLRERRPSAAAARPRPTAACAASTRAGSRSASRRRRRYEEVRTDLPAGAVVVLYTDGVIEARRDGELYGVERLDALLARAARRSRRRARRGGRSRTAAASRGGELADDVAVVVIRRT